MSIPKYFHRGCGGEVLVGRPPISSYMESPPDPYEYCEKCGKPLNMEDYYIEGEEK